MKPFLRWLLFVCLTAIVAGAGFAGWRYLNRQVTIRVAVASLEAEDATLIVALNRWLAANNRKYRMKPVAAPETRDAFQAVIKGEAELASVRADVVLPTGLASAAVLFKETAVIVAAPQSGVTGWMQLRGKSIGVVGKTALNDPLLLALLRLNGVNDAKLSLLPTGQIDREIQRKTVQALAQVGPIIGGTPADVGFNRPMRMVKGAPLVLALEDAEAVAAQDRRYEAFAIPPGGLRPTPPLPEETASTLAVSRHLVGRRNTSSFLVQRFLAELMEARRGVLGELPLAAQIGAPDTEKNAAVPVHEGATAFFGDEQESLFDTLTEWVYLAPVLAGALGTAMIWLYQFLWPQRRAGARNLLGEFLQLRRAAGGARSVDDVASLERRLDGLIDQLGAKLARGDLSEEQALSLFMSADFAERRLKEARIALTPQAA